MGFLDRVKDKAEEMSKKAKPLAERAVEKAKPVAGNLKGHAEKVAGSVKSSANNFRDGYHEDPAAPTATAVPTATPVPTAAPTPVPTMPTVAGPVDPDGGFEEHPSPPSAEQLDPLQPSTSANAVEPQTEPPTG